jgi:ribose 5-phosphate isomerase B
MIYIGSDHRGFALKGKIKQWLAERDIEFKDLGSDHYDPEDDYPDFAHLVAKKVDEEEGSRGILICGSGVGMDIVANRYPKVRCGLGFSPLQIIEAREDDDINCLAIAADFTDEEEVKEIIEAFLKTKFSGQERKKRRIKNIERY